MAWSPCKYAGRASTACERSQILRDKFSERQNLVQPVFAC
ncbi:uncharacterized protein METZ01_LOCUS64596 [marine metagenome]|uniref:Uncharacterized protein n=1 Tax=marine metagenome TaxID=408172 RepID=A0A381T6D3_9ZZZZ